MSFSTEHSFTDNEGRVINFEVGNDIVAHVHCKEVGHVQFDFDEVTAAPYLYHVSVEHDYLRAGIGTEMIRLAVGVHGPRFGRPTFQACGGSNSSSSDYFTDEGAALIRRCIALGIIDDIHREHGRSVDDAWHF